MNDVPTTETATDGPPYPTRIRELNDAFRRSGIGGRTMVTAGVAALSVVEQLGIVAAVQAFDAFTAEDDPYGEHDFGAVEVGSGRYFWKIDYFDHSLRLHSPNPADPSVTKRILTILTAGEY